MSIDFVQLQRECLVSALDTAPLVVAASGRANANVIAWDDLAAGVLPIIAYRITNAMPSGGLGDERQVHITFKGVAATEAQANELLGAVEQSLTFVRLRDAVPSIAAYRLYSEEDRAGADYDDEVEAYVAEFDAVLVASNPNP